MSERERRHRGGRVTLLADEAVNARLFDVRIAVEA